MQDRSTASKVVDGVGSVLLLCLLGTLASVLFCFGPFIAFGADACGDPGVRCSEVGIASTVVAIRWVPVVVLLLAIAVTCVRAARRRLAVPIPLIGIAVVIVVVLGCLLLANLSIHVGA